MKYNRSNYYASRIKLEKLKQKTWLRIASQKRLLGNFEFRGR